MWTWHERRWTGNCRRTHFRAATCKAPWRVGWRHRLCHNDIGRCGSSRRRVCLGWSRSCSTPLPEALPHHLHDAAQLLAGCFEVWATDPPRPVVDPYGVVRAFRWDGDADRPVLAGLLIRAVSWRSRRHMAMGSGMDERSSQHSAARLPVLATWPIRSHFLGILGAIAQPGKHGSAK
jgi:hypothetical protein